MIFRVVSKEDGWMKTIVSAFVLNFVSKNVPGTVVDVSMVLVVIVSVKEVSLSYEIKYVEKQPNWF